MTEIKHKKLFAMLLWSVGIAMILTTFIWSLFHPVGDAGMIEKLIWSALGGGAFLSSAELYGKLKQFKNDNTK
jgi:hypothetical protein